VDTGCTSYTRTRARSFIAGAVRCGIGHRRSTTKLSGHQLSAYGTILLLPRHFCPGKHKINCTETAQDACPVATPSGRMKRGISTEEAARFVAVPRLKRASTVTRCGLCGRRSNRNNHTFILKLSSIVTEICSLQKKRYNCIAHANLDPSFEISYGFQH
jgi:hypothetical protein